MSKAQHVLVVDDEKSIRRFLSAGLAEEGYEVSLAETGSEAIEKTVQGRPDVVILDLGLPDIDGKEVIQRIRKLSAVPIIILSVRADESGKVQALDLGADDYVTKPFGMEELNARIRTALRRRLQEQGAPPVYRCGDLAVDLVRRLVTLGGREVRLSVKEFEVLRLLVSQAGRVLTHEFILREVWGPANAENIQYLRVYVRSLRHKLEKDPTQPHYILTETGVGYRLKAPD
ncbi:MAG TPA: response regulator transcription factor [Alphaproteobacteria bacterium]|nr:response regulator transcription factor [Alphaproteobacteria bacterium]